MDQNYSQTRCQMCGVCLLEWVVADKTCDAEKRSLAIDLVMETLSKKAEQDGFRCIFASIKNESLRQRYENLGFVTTDTGITNLLRRIF